MLIVPGQPGKDVCDQNLGPTRRDLLRVAEEAESSLTSQIQTGKKPKPTALVSLASFQSLCSLFEN